MLLLVYSMNEMKVKSGHANVIIDYHDMTAPLLTYDNV